MLQCYCYIHFLCKWKTGKCGLPDHFISYNHLICMYICIPNMQLFIVCIMIIVCVMINWSCVSSSSTYIISTIKIIYFWLYSQSTSNLLRNAWVLNYWDVAIEINQFIKAKNNFNIIIVPYYSQCIFSKLSQQHYQIVQYFHLSVF